MKVAIPGGTGLVGRNLVPRLVEAGHEPVVLTRDPERASPRMSGVEMRRWRVGEEATERSLEGADAVVNLAGEPIAGGRWTKDRKARIRDSRILGTRQIISAMERMDRRPAILVAGSAAGFYGSRGDDILREDEGPGTDFLAGVCRDVEAEALRAEALGVRVIRLRTAAILSSEAGALPKMLTPFKLGLGGRIGSGRQWFPWIHEADIARAILFCLDGGGISGAVNAASPGAVRNSELTRVLAGTLSRPALLPIPAAILRALYGEMAVVLVSSIRAVPGALESAGFEFEFPDIERALGSLLG